MIFGETVVQSNITSLLVEPHKSTILEITSNSTGQVYIYSGHGNTTLQVNCSYGDLGTCDLYFKVIIVNNSERYFNLILFLFQ